MLAPQDISASILLSQIRHIVWLNDWGQNMLDIEDSIRTESEHDVEAPSEVLSIKTPLSYYSVCEVAHSSAKRCIGHDHNQAMFFEVERSWVEIPLQAESVESAIRENYGPTNTERICNQLDNDTADRESWSSQRE